MRKADVNEKRPQKPLAEKNKRSEGTACRGSKHPAGPQAPRRPVETAAEESYEGGDRMMSGCNLYQHGGTRKRLLEKQQAV